jgi:hypothetical protein
MANPVPTAGKFPLKHRKREAKVIETAIAGAAAAVTAGVEADLASHTEAVDNPHTVTKAQVLVDELVVNADVDDNAAIAQSKLSLAITDAEVDNAAAIAQSKLNLAVTPTEMATVVGDADKVVSYASATGVPQAAKIVDANVDAAAAIAESKLSLTVGTSSLASSISTLDAKVAKLVEVEYDFAVDGGDIGTISLAEDQIPVGSVILALYQQVDTNLNSAASGGKLQLVTADYDDGTSVYTPQNILTVKATADGSTPAPSFNALNSVQPITFTTAAGVSHIAVVIEDEALTAGKVKWWIKYI